NENPQPARRRVYGAGVATHLAQGLSASAGLWLFAWQRQAAITAGAVGVANHDACIHTQAKARVHLFAVSVCDVDCGLYPTTASAAIASGAANTASHLTRGKQQPM